MLQKFISYCNVMFSVCSNDDYFSWYRFIFQIFKSAKLLGYFVPPEIWCRMLLQNISLARADGPSDTFPNLLCLLASFIQGSDKESIQPHVVDIVDVIGVSSVCRFPAVGFTFAIINCIYFIFLYRIFILFMSSDNCILWSDSTTIDWLCFVCEVIYFYLWSFRMCT